MNPVFVKMDFFIKREGKRQSAEERRDKNRDFTGILPIYVFAM